MACSAAPMQVSSLSGFISSIAVSYSFCQFVLSSMAALPPQEYTGLALMARPICSLARDAIDSFGRGPSAGASNSADYPNSRKFSSKLSYRRISISLTTCLTLGTSAATFCASCRCLAVLTVPLTVSTPFLALNLMCCLSKAVEINAAL